MIRAYLDELTRRLSAQLGDRLVAAWQVGSGALGDFDPLRSDIDVQAVSAPLERADLEALAAVADRGAVPGARARVRALRGSRRGSSSTSTPGPACRTTRAMTRTRRSGSGSCSTSPSREPTRCRWPGPTRPEILPELPRELVLTAHRESLVWWREHDAAQAVLAACRAWAWAVEGRFLSKGEAASWGSTRLGDAAPIATALAQRADPAAPAPTPADVAAVVDHVMAVLDST